MLHSCPPPPKNCKVTVSTSEFSKFSTKSEIDELTANKKKFNFIQCIWRTQKFDWSGFLALVSVSWFRLCFFLPGNYFQLKLMLMLTHYFFVFARLPHLLRRRKPRLHDPGHQEQPGVKQIKLFSSYLIDPPQFFLSLPSLGCEPDIFKLF
jgi:hypothetical protein